MRTRSQGASSLLALATLARRSAPRVAVGLVAVALAVQVLSLGLQLFAPSANTITLPAVSRINLGDAGHFDLATLTRANLFGERATVAVKAIAADAPPTSAALSLVGIVARRGHPEDGYAIIRAAAQPDRLMRAGAPIDESTALRAIYPGHVILERDGRVESLRLPTTALRLVAAPLPIDAGLFVIPEGEEAEVGPPAPPPPSTAFEPTSAQDPSNQDT